MHTNVQGNPFETIRGHLREKLGPNDAMRFCVIGCNGCVRSKPELSKYI